jgi:aspartate racemase
LRSRGFQLVDSNQAYVRAALSHNRAGPGQVKLGVVGGVGPAATVDFLGKLVKNTPAGKDQDHIKVVVEQNPQIPDRTAHLVGEGTDPTVSLYSTCKRLEAADAALIAIPCNTAHAFVERIQPYLSIPIISMLETTAEHLREHLAPSAKVGLLATTGTVQSGLYAEAIARVGLDLLVPDAPHQEQVMSAIYGPSGVKAGFTSGLCGTQLLAALDHLVDRGAQAVILGCTELPLVLAASEALEVGGRKVRVVDPTELLARRCVGLALASAA